MIKPRIIASIIIAAVLLPVVATAQHLGQRRQPTRVAATLVLVDVLPAPGAKYAILRRTHETPADIVMLRADADSADLSEAVWELLTIRSVEGDTSRAEHLVRTRYAAGERPQRRVIRWAGRVRRDLDSAEPHAIGGLGTYRAVDIWLPPQRRRP